MQPKSHEVLKVLKVLKVPSFLKFHKSRIFTEKNSKKPSTLVLLFNTNSQEIGRSLCVPGWPGLHSGTLSQTGRQADRQTDGQTDGRTISIHLSAMDVL